MPNSCQAPVIPSGWGTEMTDWVPVPIPPECGTKAAASCVWYGKVIINHFFSWSCLVYVCGGKSSPFPGIKIQVCELFTISVQIGQCVCVCTRRNVCICSLSVKLLYFNQWESIPQSCDCHVPAPIPTAGWAGGNELSGRGSSWSLSYWA